MTRALSITSYFNPLAEQHSVANTFKTLSSPKKAVIVVLSILSAILSLPVGGLGGLGLFRKMTEMYSETEQKTVDVQQKILPPPQKNVPHIFLKKEAVPETIIEIPEEPLVEERTDNELSIVIEELAEETKEEKPVEKPNHGYMVQIFGKERISYWCPKIGALVGAVLGFYGTNLGVNFSIYFAQSKLAESEALSQAAEKLTPFIGKCVTCQIDTNAIPIDKELARIIEVNKASNQLLIDAAASLTKASLQATTKPMLSIAGANSAVHFAKDAVTGDVPISILRLANYVGGAIGGATGYLAGERVASWLRSALLHKPPPSH